jgi:hypothetical protein
MDTSERIRVLRRAGFSVHEVAAIIDTNPDAVVSNQMAPDDPSVFGLPWPMTYLGLFADLPPDTEIPIGAVVVHQGTVFVAHRPATTADVPPGEFDSPWDGLADSPATGAI